MSELNELLEQAKSAGSLRRKETFRLVEAGKKVSVAIVDAARDAGITVALPRLSLREKTRLAITRDHEVWGLAVQKEVAPDYAEHEEWRGKPFALATGTKMSDCWEIPPNNPHHLPAGAVYLEGRWLYYCADQENIPLTPAYAEEVAQWLPTQKRPLAEPPESLTRSQWIEVAGQLVPLAKKLAESAAARAAKTTTAADLAERLQNARSGNTGKPCIVIVPGKEGMMGKGYTEKIANLTLHRATAEQMADGVINLGEEKEKELRKILTFSEPPSQAFLEVCACEIAELILGRYNKAMIGGAPYLMRPLEEELEKMKIEVFYSFSKRESEEIPQKDGTVKKIAVFRHVGFVKQHV